MNALARSLITATAASSLISTFIIGYFGNLPLALAPGIGGWGGVRSGEQRAERAALTSKAPP